MTATRPPVLMNPGPVVTDDRVRSALSGPDLCHREPEFAALMQRVRRKTVAVARGTAEHTSVVLTGSGTAAVEAAVSSAIPPDGGLLVIDNGHYGERFAMIADAYGIAHRRLDFGWGVPVDLATVERALVEDPSLTHVGLAHHETSTGMLNDLAGVVGAAHRHGRQVVVDAVSSIGAEDVDVTRDRIDWLAGSANKCLEGMPGLSFVVGSAAGFAALEGRAPRSFSLDLHRHHVAQEIAGAPAFTPGIPAYYAFDVALDLALAEGIEARGKRYLALAERLRSGLTGFGLEILLEPRHRAVSLTAVRLPAGLTYPQLHAALRAEGFVIYAGQGRLASDFFRLSTMGQMSPDDVERFLDVLGRLLDRRAR